MNKPRRVFIRQLGSGVTALSLTVLTSFARASDRPKLDPEDSAAKALGYVHRAPNPSKRCGDCQLYKGSGSAEWGPCSVFPGKLVNARGWCSAWSA